MDVTKRNLEAFENGIAKGLKESRSKFVEFGKEVVKDLVTKSVESYSKEDANLTGNLLNSIAGGIYFNGRIASIVFPEDVKEETHTYTYVGDGPFEEYGTGDTVYFVFQYRKPYEFQKVDGNGTGRDSAFKFLKDYVPKSKFFEIVICAAAPYASYLQEVRKLDVLMTANDRKREVWRRHVKILQV